MLVSCPVTADLLMPNDTFYIRDHLSPFPTGWRLQSRSICFWNKDPKPISPTWYACVLVVLYPTFSQTSINNITLIDSRPEKMISQLVAWQGTCKWLQYLAAGTEGPDWHTWAQWVASRRSCPAAITPAFAASVESSPHFLDGHQFALFQGG